MVAISPWSLPGKLTLTFLSWFCLYGNLTILVLGHHSCLYSHSSFFQFGCLSIHSLTISTHSASGVLVFLEILVNGLPSFQRAIMLCWTAPDSVSGFSGIFIGWYAIYSLLSPVYSMNSIPSISQSFSFRTCFTRPSEVTFWFPSRKPVLTCCESLQPDTLALKHTPLWDTSTKKAEQWFFSVISFIGISFFLNRKVISFFVRRILALFSILFTCSKPQSISNPSWDGKFSRVGFSCPISLLYNLLQLQHNQLSLI